MAAKESTLVLLKPDIVERKFCGDVLRELEPLGRFAACRLIRMTQELCRQHYAHVLQESHYPDVEAYMLSGPTLACVWRGGDVVRTIRERVLELRMLYAESPLRSAIHASDSPEAAAEEISRFFREEEIV